MEELFKGAYIGIKDKNGNKIHEGSYVKFYYRGEYVICTIIYYEGIFCLKWSDGYINKYHLNTYKNKEGELFGYYEIVDEEEAKRRN